MLVPGASKFGVLVTLVDSMRTSTLKRSRIGNCLNSARFNDLEPGARRSSNAGGSGDITYWSARGRNAFVLKYGLSTLPVASRLSPRRDPVEPSSLGLTSRIGRPLA